MNDELERTDHRTGQQGETADPAAPDRHADSMQPIAGVGLDLYARIVRSIALMNDDLSMLGPMAALHGVGNDEWVQARHGWNERIASDDAVNYLFRELYEAS